MCAFINGRGPFIQQLICFEVLILPKKDNLLTPSVELPYNAFTIVIHIALRSKDPKMMNIKFLSFQKFVRDFVEEWSN